MKITKIWLVKNYACKEGIDWFLNQEKSDAVEVLLSLINHDKLNWANWTISRILNRKNKIRYAVFAAEQVLEIYEKKYPTDKRPRQAINAAKKVIANDTIKNRAAAYSATFYATYAAYSAAKASHSSAFATNSAAKAAVAAAKAAFSADAADAADAARYASDAADAAKNMAMKIIIFGLDLA